MTFTPDSLPDLSGRVYLVTGGNTGIGLNTVSGLVSRNAKVYLGARSKAKADAAVDGIKVKYPNAEVSVLVMDMMDLRSVRAAAKEFLRNETSLHGLVNNAGIMATPYEESKDHYEAQFQTNYLSHWLLTYSLLPCLNSSAESTPPGTVRIVNVSSDGHLIFAPSVGIDFEDIYQARGGPWSRYGMSKLANILHAKELHRRYGPSAAKESRQEIWTASLHPGTIDTGLGHNASGLLFQIIRPVALALGLYSPVETAAYTSLYAIASPEFTKELSGEYLKPVGVVGKTSRHGMDSELAERLWAWTETEMRTAGLIE